MLQTGLVELELLAIQKKYGRFNWTFNVLFSVLESGRILRNSINHTCIIWRWSVGICDVWLHSLLPAPWATIHRPSKTSQGEDLMPLIKSHELASCSMEMSTRFWFLETLPDMQRYHLSHHFRIQDMGFGITSSLWDAVFGTLPPSMTPGKKNWRT